MAILADLVLWLLPAAMAAAGAYYAGWKAGNSAAWGTVQDLAEAARDRDESEAT